LPGNFFPVPAQKKGSINHCYPSVTIESAIALAALVSRHKSPAGVIEFILLKRAGDG
jgi:hypothetical protein